MKATQRLAGEKLQKVLAVARGEAQADLVLKNVKLIDVATGDIYKTSIAICGEIIAGVGESYAEASTLESWDCEGLFAAPGFIDAHVHIESSLMHPFEFERLVLPLGTTSVVCDPHEITNVLGIKGLEWFLRCSEEATMNLFVQAPSCVPALPGLETQSGELMAQDLQASKDHPSLLGLGEMMNYPGVIQGHEQVLEKLALFEGKPLDGHAPLLSEKDLNAYVAAGIQNCHETTLKSEGQNKLRKGMGLMLREGSVAKNLDELAPLITEMSSTQCMLCTDDRNPIELLHEGHINSMVKRLIQTHKLSIPLAYRVASYSTARHYGLKSLGLIAPGQQADILLLKDPALVQIQEVLIKGERISTLSLKDKSSEKYQNSKPPRGNSIKREFVSAEDFKLDFSEGLYHVISLIPNQIITKMKKIPYAKSEFTEKDVLKLAVVERYGKQQKVALGLVQGFELKSGALASSVAHDCHNIVVVGTNDEDMEIAVNALIVSGGGYCVVDGGDVKKTIPLPIGGLMSLESGEALARELEFIKGAYRWQGVKLEAPFLQLAFLALPVIPELRLSDKGLFSSIDFKFVDLKLP